MTAFWKKKNLSSPLPHFPFKAFLSSTFFPLNSFLIAHVFPTPQIRGNRTAINNLDVTLLLTSSQVMDKIQCSYYDLIFQMRKLRENITNKWKILKPMFPSMYSILKNGISSSSINFHILMKLILARNEKKAIFIK